MATDVMTDPWKSESPGGIAPPGLLPLAAYRWPEFRLRIVLVD
jgi:hypothetical protein